MQVNIIYLNITSLNLICLYLTTSSEIIFPVIYSSRFQHWVIINESC